MEIVRKKIRDLDRAAYNPRIDLIPGDTEYENLRRSIITYGMIIPVVWNQRTNRVVGGHQRLTVLENEGETEVDVSVVDLDETQERQLNVALNKIEGGWDEEKLSALLAELGDDAPLTGFTQAEIDSLTNDIDSLIDGDTVDEELRAIMSSIYDASAAAAEEYGLGYDLIAGNDIAAFKKISEAMIAQGL